MVAVAAIPSETNVQPTPAWGAVMSMALCVALLIASEFMPVSLLTPMAQGLGASAGQTGRELARRPNSPPPRAGFLESTVRSSGTRECAGPNWGWTMSENWTA